jgi:hypothetical protein
MPLEHLDKWKFKSLRKRLQAGEVAVTTWFERDRAHVALQEVATGEILVDWWDEAVNELFEDGFFKNDSILNQPRTLGPAFKESVVAYAEDIGIPAYPRKEKKAKKR